MRLGYDTLSMIWQLSIKGTGSEHVEFFGLTLLSQMSYTSFDLRTRRGIFLTSEFRRGYYSKVVRSTSSVFEISVGTEKKKGGMEIRKSFKTTAMEILYIFRLVKGGAYDDDEIRFGGGRKWVSDYVVGGFVHGTKK